MAQQRLKQLVEHKALPPSHGWSETYVDEVIWAQILEPISQNEAAVTFMGAVETGIAICNALNAAVDEGLGTCLHAFSAPDVIKEQFNVPDTWVPVWLQEVGYSLEETEAGGQRPRRPLGTMFFEGSLRHAVEGGCGGHRAPQAGGDDPAAGAVPVPRSGGAHAVADVRAAGVISRP